MLKKLGPYARPYSKWIAVGVLCSAAEAIFELLIPLVPGRPLYYAMYYAVQQDMDLSADFARQTALYALGIALGASLVWALADMRRHLKQNGLGN